MNAKITKSKKKSDPVIKFMKTNSDMFTFLKEGDLVKGTIIEKTPMEIVVDLGKYGTGIIYRGEFMNARNVVRDKEAGDEIQGKVIEIDNSDGIIELSISEAEKQKNWIDAEEMMGKEEVVEVQPTDSNKGGLIVPLCGLSAFLPASQLTPENYPDVEGNDEKKIEEELSKLVNSKLKVKIIDVNPRNNKFIVSEKAAYEISAKELAQNYEVGQVIEGIVSGIADFGVFIKFADNPNVEGLIHISELDHKVVDNPKEIVEVDQAVQAKIIDIKEGKIALSLKALKEDPWKDIDKELKEGQEIEGEVYSFNPFGAIVNLENGFQGQIHVTDFGGVEEMKKEIKKGEKYTFTTKEIKQEEKRIVLSIKK